MKVGRKGGEERMNDLGRRKAKRILRGNHRRSFRGQTITMEHEGGCVLDLSSADVTSRSKDRFKSLAKKKVDKKISGTRGRRKDIAERLQR